MEFPENPQPNLFFQFTSARQQRIYTKLQLLGSGPAAFYFDACRLMELEPPLISTTHVVSHLLREIESALRAIVTAASGAKINAVSQAKYRESIENVLTFLGISNDEQVGKLWLSLTDTNGALHARAHRDALAYRPNSPEFKVFWDNMETIFDNVLKRFEEKYLSAHQLIDELLEKTNPNDGDVKRLRNNVPNSPPALQHFFSKADGKWLILLREEFFKLPPGIDPITNNFVPWPESQFLVRVTKSEPQSVLDIVLQLPETNNPYILDDICDIALELPIELLVEILPRIKNSLNSDYQRMLPFKVAGLINRLIKNVLFTNALDLTHNLLAILPNPEVTIFNWRKIQAKYPAYIYKEILEEYIWDLAELVPVDFAIILSDLIDQGIQSLTKDTASTTDPSQWWAIIQHSDHGDEIEEILITALQTTTSNLADREPKDLVKIFDNWEKYPWAVFRRLTLYLLAHYPLSSPDLISIYLTNHDFVEDFSNEYYLLLQSGFEQLDTSKQEVVISWLLNNSTDQPEQLHWLSAIKNNLTSDLQIRFEQLVQIHGQPKQFTYQPPLTTAFWGDGSPKSSSELLVMDSNDLFAFLRDWHPSGEFGSLTRDGLGEHLRVAIANSPNKFAEQAMRFAELPYVYTNYFLAGLKEACTQKIDFPWPPVLELCSQILSRISLESVSGDLSWSRAAISDLLAGGFNYGVLNYELRELAWEIIVSLVSKSPNSDDEYANLPHNLSASEVSYNTFRGRALRVAMRYIFWTERHLSHSSAEFTMTFDVIPEVKALLEGQLYVDSLSVKALFGQYIPYLDLLSKDWLQENFKRIFVDDDRLWDAVWSSYVTHCEPFDRNLIILEDEYIRAVNQAIAQQKEVNAKLSFETTHLISHLMVFYIRGLINLEESGGLLSIFYQGASDKLCAYAVKYLGQILKNSGEPISEEMLIRFIVFWNTRTTQCIANPEIHPNELLAFGWWYISNKLDPVWANDELKQVLILVPNFQVEMVDRVVETMARLSKETSQDLIDSLDLIVERTKELWQIDIWEKYIRSVLTTSLNSSNIPSRQKSVAFINKLAARGYMGLVDLLIS